MEHPTHRRRSEMKPGSGENSSDASGAGCRVVDLEPPNDVSDELRKPTDRLAELDEGGRPLVVEPLGPGSDRERRHEHPSSGLG